MHEGQNIRDPWKEDHDFKTVKSTKDIYIYIYIF